MTREVEVVRTYLELRSRAALSAGGVADPSVRFERRDHCSPSDYRRLYRGVGERWYWRDRLAWSDEQLANLLESPDIALWECVVGSESAGYFELAHQPDGSVEIAYFGLLPAFIGRGLGGAMLTRAVEEAWAFGANRVWLHTCTLDSPHALPNYKARGFIEFNVERYMTHIER